MALVLNKIQSEAKEYYEGVTVLPVEWAYMNSRLIVKPDEEWAKIMDEIDGAETESIQGVDKKLWFLFPQQRNGRCVISPLRICRFFILLF